MNFEPVLCVLLRKLWYSSDIFGSLQTSSVVFGNLRQFSGIFGNVQKSSEMIGNRRKVAENVFIYNKQNNIGLFGVVFVSFWTKFTVTVNFFTVSVKVPKILLFHVTTPKNKRLVLSRYHPFRPSSKAVSCSCCPSTILPFKRARNKLLVRKVAQVTVSRLIRGT